jgi:hypothetical protein
MKQERIDIIVENLMSVISEVLKESLAPQEECDEPSELEPVEEKELPENVK